MRALRSSTCVIACVAGLWVGCGEPVLGDYPTEPPDTRGASTEGTCLDGEVQREVIAPAPGTVRVVEWMANPAGVDGDLEWVEVFFAEQADLNGFALGTDVESANEVVESADCVPVDAGSWVVFGASPAAAPRVDAELPFNLANTGRRSIVATVGGILLDRVDYEGARDGVSTQLDETGGQCDAARDAPYAGSNFGTPGAANPACDRPLRDGECLDEGVARVIDVPGPGDASIREWMPNPSAVENRDGEWVEVRFERAADLNGLTLADLSGESVFESETCVGVPAGGLVVFAREGDGAINGGLGVAPYPMSIALNNRDETIELRVDGELLDSVSYARSEPGVAQQVDEEGTTCASTQPYGDGDLGSPGFPNPSCI